MKYRIGLDIGIASVGGCAMECDENGEPVRILDLCVRAFEAAEVSKTGAPPALDRRTARGIRRLLRRRAHRLERVRALCAEKFGEGILERAEENRDDLFRLRYVGLSEPLTDEQLVRLLIYFAGHRGFRSNRKSEGKDKETGKLLAEIRKNKEYMRECGYRTLREIFYRRTGQAGISHAQQRGGVYPCLFACGCGRGSAADFEKTGGMRARRRGICGKIHGDFSLAAFV